ncbi:hypothetical protein VTL71DRAFT_15389 [Oculimacula yallundae]|uniref:Uncharacterized protein n=1 Tax=Oculimacula yallundae TaxID=86028 RepID=A0ABR4CHR3_9HELO
MSQNERHTRTTASKAKDAKCTTLIGYRLETLCSSYKVASSVREGSEWAREVLGECELGLELEFEGGGLGKGALRVLKDDVVRLWSCQARVGEYGGASQDGRDGKEGQKKHQASFAEIESREKGRNAVRLQNERVRDSKQQAASLMSGMAREEGDLQG